MYNENDGVSTFFTALLWGGALLGSYHMGKNKGVETTTREYEDQRRDQEISQLRQEIAKLKGITHIDKNV